MPVQRVREQPARRLFGGAILRLCRQVPSQGIKQRGDALLMSCDLFTWRCILYLGPRNSLPLSINPARRPSSQASKPFSCPAIILVIALDNARASSVNVGDGINSN